MQRHLAAERWEDRHPPKEGFKKGKGRDPKMAKVGKDRDPKKGYGRGKMIGEGIELLINYATS